MTQPLTQRRILLVEQIRVQLPNSRVPAHVHVHAPIVSLLPLFSTFNFRTLAVADSASWPHHNITMQTLVHHERCQSPVGKGATALLTWIKVLRLRTQNWMIGHDGPNAWWCCTTDWQRCSWRLPWCTKSRWKYSTVSCCGFKLLGNASTRWSVVSHYISCSKALPD